jgi:hypothetical protein
MLGHIHLAGKGATLTNEISTFTLVKKDKTLEKIDLLLGIINTKELLDTFDILARKHLELKKTADNRK